MQKCAYLVDLEILQLYEYLLAKSGFGIAENEPSKVFETRTKNSLLAARKCCQKFERPVLGCTEAVFFRSTFRWKALAEIINFGSIQLISRLRISQVDRKTF